MLNGLRDQLTTLGVSPFDIELPDEERTVAPLEGALRLRVADGQYVLETVDYGQGWRLGWTTREADARQLVLNYISRPLPPVVAIPATQVDQIVAQLAPQYDELRNRITAAGDDRLVIDLPENIPVDRIGALDGIHVYPINTPFEARSLPPTALRPENDVHKFLTRSTLRVGVTITPPWFGRPGGGMRFTLQAPAVGLRDLVVSGVLQRIHVVT